MKMGTLMVLLKLCWVAKESGGSKEQVKTAANLLLPAAAFDARVSVIQPILMSSNPIYLLMKKADNYHTLFKAHSDFLEQENHGMFIHENVIYPINLNLKTQEELDFAIETENDLYGQITQQFAIDNKFSAVEGQVLLFPEWGFSGEMKTIKSIVSKSTGETSMRKLFMAGSAVKRIKTKTQKKKK